MGIRSSSNRVGSVLDQYREQLSPLYEAGEVRAIARAVFHEKLGWDAAQLESRKLESLHESDLLKVYLPLKRLRAGEPLQHILGKVRFHGLEISVTPDVLIPRPETEELVELIAHDGFSPTGIADVGTGSGCIALALKQRFPAARIIGIDVSVAALAVARSNGESLGLDVAWQLDDALSEGFELPGGLDLVVSNPPYIPLEEAGSLLARVRAREPYIALFAPEGDPLAFYRAIGHSAARALRNGGRLWFEAHYRHAALAASALRSIGFSQVDALSDMSGNERFIRCVR
ncbi:MAG: peptide chain release factor N(5)-glutamine methyltransferase [Flavobacteriales bacterium]|jgi:release factor glutamine methyltransferase|nr:peptide chain release factor N(5)-glutamine methyltransferase [Flavobacteriales bacterium]